MGDSRAFAKAVVCQGWADSEMPARLAAMSASQPDLFGGLSPAPAQQLTEEELVLVRGRLHAALALVKSAKEMPWPDMSSVIREDNAFRYAKGLLPPAEGRRCGPNSTWRWTGSTRS